MMHSRMGYLKAVQRMGYDEFRKLNSRMGYLGLEEVQWIGYNDCCISFK